MLSKQDILDARDRRTETFFVEQWGGEVELMALSVSAKEELASFYIERQETGNYAGARALVASMGIVCDGERVFTAEELAEKSEDAINAIYERVLSISGMRDDEIAEMEKNSEAGRPEGLAIG